VGELYPDVKVWGFDFWTIQPLWIPNNVNFIIDDIELEWVLLDMDRGLSYLHAREMILAIRDWPYFLEQAFRSA
jgi:hypothetical protein